jgi:hypothetical protein
MDKRFGALVVLIFGVMAMACAPPLPPSPSTTTLSATLQCPAEKIQFTKVWRGKYTIGSGCDKIDIVSGDTSLRNRAAFDLQCDAQSLNVVVIGEGSFGVAGCSRRATYVWADRAGFATDNIQQPSSAPSAMQLK